MLKTVTIYTDYVHIIHRRINIQFIPIKVLVNFVLLDI